MNTNRREPSGWLVCAMLAAGLAGCGSTGGAQRGAQDEAFPDPADARPREGLYVNVDNLRQTAPGMSKRQLYALLGTPHFNEGLWGVREWNYLFNFRRGPGSQEHFTCQLKVSFDSEGYAQAYHWKPAACKGLTDPLPPAAVAPAPPPAHEPLRLSADTLFAFDSAELSASGRNALDALLRQARSAGRVQDIVVAGHTDRIGSDAYNLDLSHRRALAVRQYLVGQGIPAAAITAEGHGKAAPLVECPGGATGAVIACLAPNRRVEISGLAMQ